jgi:hypothetical protein
MAAQCEIKAILEMTGLGKELFMDERFNTTATPDAVTYNYRTQATADTEEALDLGDVATVELIWIKCISKDLAIDTSFSATFSTEIELQEGEVAVFKPAGTVYVRNLDTVTDDNSVYEYVVIGTT